MLPTQVSTPAPAVAPSAGTGIGNAAVTAKGNGLKPAGTAVHNKDNVPAVEAPRQQPFNK